MISKNLTVGDKISREELKRTMYHEVYDRESALVRWNNGCWIRYKLFDKVVTSIPACTNTNEKKGEWRNADGLFVCTNCKAECENTTRYCPNCGARMEEWDDTGTS